MFGTENLVNGCLDIIASFGVTFHTWPVCVGKKNAHIVKKTLFLFLDIQALWTGFDNLKINNNYKWENLGAFITNRPSAAKFWRVFCFFGEYWLILRVILKDWLLSATHQTLNKDFKH